MKPPEKQAATGLNIRVEDTGEMVMTYMGPLPLQGARMSCPLPSYTTSDEKSFIRTLYLTNRPAFSKYAAIVHGDRRRYDKNVDVAEVRRYLAALESGI